MPEQLLRTHSGMANRINRTKEGITMAHPTIIRLTSAAVVTGIASLALAAPASAVHPKDPGAEVGSGSNVGRISYDDPPLASDGWEFWQVAAGASGGVVLAGMGVAAAAGLRRHQDHLAHPA